MKKFALCFAIILACLPFVACKKSTTPANNEKDFSLYFPVVKTITNETESKNTETIFGLKQAFYSISFTADETLTSNIFAHEIEFEVLANQNTSIDFLITITTKDEQVVIPCVCEVTNGSANIIISPEMNFDGETMIEIALTLPGGHGIDGMIYDKTNALTGFEWGIGKIIFKAEHK